jgi:hypothetical protein
MKLNELRKVLAEAKPFPLRLEDGCIHELAYWQKYEPVCFFSYYPSLSNQLGSKSLNEIVEHCQTLFRLDVFSAAARPLKIINVINDNQYVVTGFKEDGYYSAKYVTDTNKQGVGHSTVLSGKVPMYKLL